VTDELPESRVPSTIAAARLWAVLRVTLEDYPHFATLDHAAERVVNLLQEDGIDASRLVAALEEYRKFYAEDMARTNAEAILLAEETQRLHATAEGEPTYLKETTT